MGQGTDGGNVESRHQRKHVRERLELGESTGELWEGPTKVGTMKV